VTPARVVCLSRFEPPSIRGGFFMPTKDTNMSLIIARLDPTRPGGWTDGRATYPDLACALHAHQDERVFIVSREADAGIRAGLHALNKGRRDAGRRYDQADR
jgi:hypothetical protein